MRRLLPLTVLPILLLVSCSRTPAGPTEQSNETGPFTTQTPERSPEELQTAAASGEARAMFELGTIAYAGLEGQPKDLIAARDWFLKGAEKGDSLSQFNIGMMMLSGEGGPQDNAGGVKWLSLSAEQENPRALQQMGIIYYLAQSGEDQDFDKAKSYFERAARTGMGPGAYNLAVMHARGEAGDEDLEEAYAWFLIARNFEYGKAIDRLVSLDAKLAQDQKDGAEARANEILTEIRAQGKLRVESLQ